jgi:hypothetical protein
MVISGKDHKENPQISGTVLNNLVALVTQGTGFMPSWLTFDRVTAS